MIRDLNVDAGRWRILRPAALVTTSVPFIMTLTWLQHQEVGVQTYLEDTSVSPFQGLLGEEMQPLT